MKSDNRLSVKKEDYVTILEEDLSMPSNKLVLDDTLTVIYENFPSPSRNSPFEFDFVVVKKPSELYIVGDQETETVKSLL